MSRRPKDVRASGLLLLLLKSLNRLEFFAGERDLDTDLADMIAALLKRTVKLRLCGGRGVDDRARAGQAPCLGFVSLDAGSGTR
jgi:hypothetical protein